MRRFELNLENFFLFLEDKMTVQTRLTHGHITEMQTLKGLADFVQYLHAVGQMSCHLSGLISLNLSTVMSRNIPFYLCRN
jgi:UDP:flavonoid glycosyltransferase YjiC (YdhE family)